MNTYSVRLGRPGGGSPTFSVIVYGLSPAMARAAAMAQYPDYAVHAVRQHDVRK
jgi:hypothetical protein